MEITRERLQTLLHYDPETGAFSWRRAQGSAAAGSKAGTPNNGYIRIRVDKQFVYAHKLAFIYMTGSAPVAQVDHINHDRADNRWVNLREATLAENNRNRPLRKTNTSGATGVTRNGKNWMAQVVFDHKHHYCGTFRDKATAQQAAEAKRAELHKNFAYREGRP